MIGALPAFGTAWTGWLVDSFIAFSALILLVLILRRPVARWFGPEAAYMLWALPALRWLMPPLALQSLGLTSITAALFPQASDPLTSPSAAPAIAVSDAAAPAQSTLEFSSLLPVIWVAGAAALFLFLIRHHLKVMAEIKNDAGDLGKIGSVALYESRNTISPLASGFWNRSIFLPQSIRHWPEEAQRMALAHEMTHHRAHHLIHNSIALALLCLNWFNPLAWLAARAFIVDQEADCDARTIAQYRFDRADYSTMLLEAAKISRTPTWTLAPTAYLIPKKAIVARIRRIAMNKNDSRMRFAGYGLAVLAGMAILPLTASIAEADEQSSNKSTSISTNDGGSSVIRISGGGEPTYRRNINYNGKSYALWSDREVSDAEVLRQFEQSEKARAEAEKAKREADVSEREAEWAREESEAEARKAEAQAAWAEEEVQRRAEHQQDAATEAQHAAEEARREAEQDARQAAEEARRDARQAAWEAQIEARNEARAEAIAAANEGRAIARAEAARARAEAQSTARAEATRARAEAQAEAARIRAEVARNAVASVDWNGVRASVDGASASVRAIRIGRSEGDGRN